MNPTLSCSAPGWTIHHFPEVGSTNDAASSLPAWNVVLADRQKGGRGRHERAWVSDPGGLWLSAVVPTGPSASAWSALPLAAGLAVCEALQSLGATPLRMRWPNDVMTGPRKLAGLLVDVFQPELAVVGVGINVTNCPEAIDPTLTGLVARVVDLVDPAPDSGVIAREILERLREVVRVMKDGDPGFAALVPRLNRWWNPAASIEIETDLGSVRGFFQGIDDEGRVRVRIRDGGSRVFAAPEVVRMREISE
ncbi:MAG: biotin--[acetyl-CoA-carboxylase] ligase [Limisphaerales bacterium]